MSNEYERLHQIRSRWQKEQQLIRKKYQISYNMVYESRSGCDNYISRVKSLCKHDQSESSSDIPLINSSKCHSMSSIDSLHEQSVTIKFSFIKRVNSKQYILLDWNNRQSLLNYIQTIENNKNFSNMTIEQLHQRITNDDCIRVYHSIIDLILSMTKEEREKFLSHIYIDPSYYSMIEGSIPLCRSQVIADNRNLNQTLYSIKKLAFLFGIKIDQPTNTSLQEKISIKQRKAILNQLSLLIASKIPYDTFHKNAVPM